MEHQAPAPTDHLLSSDTPYPDRASQITLVDTDPKAFEKAHLPNHAITGRFEAWWILELVGLLVSMVCIILIITLLKIHDGQPFASWDFYLSLNTIVSVLGSITRVTLLAAVSASIAQGKWIWFRKRSDAVNMFEVIDSASRETLGSLKLMWHTRGCHLISIGAFVTVLSITVEPSLQALISDVGRLDNVINPLHIANISKAERFDGGTECITQTSPLSFSSPQDMDLQQNVSTTPDFGISAAIYAGLNVDPLPTVTFACSSGNCTWSLYASLAVTSSCFNVSEHLFKQMPKQSMAVCPATYEASMPPSLSSTRSLSSKSSHYSSMASSTGLSSTLDCMSLDGGLADFNGSAIVYNLDYIDLSIQNFQGKWDETGYGLGTIMTAAITADPNSTVNFKDSQTLLAAFSIIRVDDGYANKTLAWDGPPITAIECGLLLSLNVYNSSVSNGVLAETLVATTSAKAPNSWRPLPDAQQTMQKNLEKASKEILGTLDWNPIYHPIYLTREDYQLDPSALKHNNITADLTFDTGFNITQRALDSTVAYITSLIPRTANQSTVNITTALSPVFGTPILQPLYDSADLSQTFDKLAKSLSNALRNTGKAQMQGLTYQWVVHYKIRWVWLTLPISLLLISTIFTFASIFETHKARIPAWKSNTVATMVWGPDELLRNRLRSGAQSHSLDKVGEVVVTLQEHAFGAALSAVSLAEKNEEGSRKVSVRF